MPGRGPASRAVASAVVTKNGPNSRNWTLIGANGADVGKIEQWESGMNYWKDGGWTPSDPTLQISPDGKSVFCDKVQSKIRIAANLNSRGSVGITTPDGIGLSTTPAAIGLYDAASGRSVVIGTIRNCTAELVSSNTVIFENAFDGVSANVVYSLKRGSFAQDVVLKQNVNPAAYGFPTNTTRIEIFTEFFDSPNPDEITRPIYTEKNAARRGSMASPDFVDHQLNFGQLEFGRGQAYAAANPGQARAYPSGPPMAKDFQTAGGRTFLIESVRYPDIWKQLQSLPPVSVSRLKAKSLKNGYAAIPTPPKMIGNVTVVKRDLPQLAQVQSRFAAGKEPSAILQQPGVVCDYVATVSGTMPEPMIWQKGTTYFISGPVYCQDATFEGGTVIKYPNDGDPPCFIEVDGSLTCQTGLYRPVVFTAGDDDSVGDPLTTLIWSGCTGTIGGNGCGSGYADPALIVNSSTLDGMHFYYAQVAINMLGNDSEVSYTLADSQFYNCIEGIAWSAASTGSLTMNNCLFAYVSTLIGDNSDETDYYAFGSYFTFNNCTIDGSALVANGVNGFDPYYYQDTVQAVNSVFQNVTLDATLCGAGGGNNAFYNVSYCTEDGYTCASDFGSNPFDLTASPYQSGAGGGYYLKPGSGLQGAGTRSGMDPNLLADLPQRTTEAPALAYFYSQTTYGPRIQRDTAGTDLGYHYDPMDFFFW